MTDRMSGSTGVWRLLRCSSQDCGLAWIYPVPTPEELAVAYEDYYTHTPAKEGGSRLRKSYERLRRGYLAARFGYEGSGIGGWEKFGGNLLAFLPNRRAAFEASVMWLPAKPGGKVLEIGCGNGDLLARLSALGWQAHGVEPDAKSAAIANARGLPVIVGEFDAQNFEPETFDAVIMSHVIEHVGDPVALLRDCRKSLKPDGRLLLLTPNMGSLGHRWFGKDWMHLDPPRHLHLFTRDSIALACQQAGFGDVECQATLRDANWTLAGSLELRRNGRYRIGELSWPMKIAGMLLLYLEWFLLKLDEKGGEELLVTAHGRNSP
jgi:2-polyprenyl-3-methyl-5-hydroxy-6-metoxy-1,4-benzoquinol methylase